MLSWESAKPQEIWTRGKGEMQVKDAVKKILTCFLLFVLTVDLYPLPPQIVLPADDAARSQLLTHPGQSVTVLPNGNLLLLGGKPNGEVVPTAAIVNGSVVTKL